MAISDIRLDNETVVVTGQTLKSKTTDFELDNNDRRADDAKTGGYRRAMVHEKPDILTINYDQDYSGGVVIRALDTIEGNPRNKEYADSIKVNSRVLNIIGSDIMLKSDARCQGKGGSMRRALVHDENDVLKLNYGKDYTGGVVVEGDIQINGNLMVDKGNIKLGNVEVSNFGVVLKDVSDSSKSISISASNGIILNYSVQTGQHSMEDKSMNLLDTIKELKSQIAELQARVAVLESK